MYACICVCVRGRRLVQSVPGELSMDHTAVLQVAEVRRGNDRREREEEPDLALSSAVYIVK